MWNIKRTCSHSFLSIFKCLFNGGNLTVSVFVDLFLCELLLDRNTNPAKESSFKVSLYENDLCVNVFSH